MEERRKQPRKDLMSYSQVFDVQEGYLIGYLGDLTQLGAMVISDIRLNTNKEMTIQIQLPELEDFSDENIVVPVRVAWCQKDISPDYFNLGLEFKILTGRQQQIIKSILDNYEFRRQIPNYPTHPNTTTEQE